MSLLLPVIPICVRVLLVHGGSRQLVRAALVWELQGLKGCTRPAASCRLCCKLWGLNIQMLRNTLLQPSSGCRDGGALWMIGSCDVFRSSCFFLWLWSIIPMGLSWPQ